MFVFPLFFFMIAGCVLLAVLVGLLADPRTRKIALGVLGVLAAVPLVVFLSYQSSGERSYSDIRSTGPSLVVTSDDGETALVSAPAAGTELSPAQLAVHRVTQIEWGALLLPVLAVAALAAAAWRCFDRRRPAAGGIVSLVAVAIVLLCGLRLWEMQRVASRPIATDARSSSEVVSAGEAFDKLTEPRIALEPPAAIEPTTAVVPPEAIATPSAVAAAQATPAPPSPASQERLTLVIALAGLVLLLVAAAYGVLKIDEATSGRYSKWLFLGAPLVIIFVVLIVCDELDFI